MAKQKPKKMPKGMHMMNGKMMSDEEMPMRQPKKKTKKRGKRGR